MTMTGGDLTKFRHSARRGGRGEKDRRVGNLHVIGLHEHTGSGLHTPESVLKTWKT